MRWHLTSIVLLALSCGEKESLTEVELCNSNTVIQIITDKQGYTSKLDEKTWVLNYIDENCDNRMLQICNEFPDSLKTESRIIFSGQIKGTPTEPPTIPFIAIQKLRKCEFDCENDNYLIPINISCENKFTTDVLHIINSQEEYETFKSTIKCQASDPIDFTKYSMAFANIRYAGCCGFPKQRVESSTSTVVIEVEEKAGCKALMESQMAFLIPKSNASTLYDIKIVKTIK